MQDSPSEFNPYQAPLRDVEDESAVPDLWRSFLQRFRSETHALAAGFVFCGVLGGLFVSLASAFSLSAPINAAWLGLVTFVAAAFGGIGVLVAMKVRNALRIGLAVMSLMPTVLTAIIVMQSIPSSGIVMLVALCSLPFVLALVQGHRVLRWMTLLQAAEIPLTIKPGELRPHHLVRLPPVPPK